MENKPKTLNPIMVAFIALQLILIIVVTISIIKINNDNIIKDDQEYYEAQPGMRITGLNSGDFDLIDGDIEYMEKSLLQLIAYNDPKISVRNTVSEVRDGSIKSLQFNGGEIRLLSAIVDVPSIEQSYHFFYVHPSSGDIYYISPDESIFVFCLEQSEGIRYQNFDCVDPPHNTNRNMIAAEFLNYFDFENFDVSVSEDFGKIFIDLYEFETEKNKIDAYIQETKDTVEAMGISADVFIYEIRQPVEETYTQY